MTYTKLRTIQLMETEGNDPEVVCRRNVTAVFARTSVCGAQDPALVPSLRIGSWWLPGNVAGVSRNQRWAGPGHGAEQPRTEGCRDCVRPESTLTNRRIPTPRRGHQDSSSSRPRLGGASAGRGCRE